MITTNETRAWLGPHPERLNFRKEHNQLSVENTSPSRLIKGSSGLSPFLFVNCWQLSTKLKPASCEDGVKATQTE